MKTDDEIKLRYNCDCVEFCPQSTAINEILANGCYELRNGHRCGSLNFFHTEKGRLVECASTETDGTLDISWLELGCNSKIIVEARANYLIALSSVVEYPTGDLNVAEEHRLRGDHEISLSIDSAGDTVVVSHADAYVSLLRVKEGELYRERELHDHQYEVWTCHFDRNNPNTLYTGGDEGFLCMRDVRESSLENRLRFDAGVSSIYTYSSLKDLIFVGCYDDKLRAYDKRVFSANRELSSLDIGGGVYNMAISHLGNENGRSDGPDNHERPHGGTAGDYLLNCASTYAGLVTVKIGYDFNMNLRKLEPFGRYIPCEDKHLLYDVSVSPVECNRIACCSFYDNIVRLCSH